MKAETRKQLERIPELSDEELNALSEQLLESADLEDSSDDNLKALEEVVAARTKITEEQNKRAESKAERDKKLEEIKSKLEPVAEEEGDDKEPKDEDAPEETKVTEEKTEEKTETKIEEPVGEQEPEKIAASAKPKPGSIRKRVPKENQKPSSSGVGFTASVSVAGKVREGDPLNPEQIAEAFSEKINGGFRGPTAVEQRMNVARLDWGDLYPEDRILDGGMRQGLLASMQVEGMNQTPDALTASGGLCAPVTPYYQLADISQAGRPVRDALVQFNAARGGIRFVPPSTILDFTGALTDHTVADDVEGATKACLDALCNADEEVNTRAVVMCLTFGNMRARTFPEQVAEHVAKTQAAHARFAERLILDAIQTASTAVSASSDAMLGAFREFFAVLDRAADQYRNRHRMPANATLQVIAPLWLKSMFQADLVRQLPGDNTYAIADAFISQAFAARNVSVTYSFESATGSGQDYAAQGVGALLGWSDSVTWYLFHPGMFLFLDGGTLDLGITRDSTLNATNDYQIFSETFEGVAAVGLESLAVTQDICPSGKSSAAEDIDPCTIGS